MRIAVVRSIVEGNGIAKVVGPPKSAAGRRIIAIFGHDARIVATHVESVKPGALLWIDRNGGYVSQSTVNNHWRKAQGSSRPLRLGVSLAAPLRGHPVRTNRHYRGRNCGAARTQQCQGRNALSACRYP